MRSLMTRSMWSPTMWQARSTMPRTMHQAYSRRPLDRSLSSGQQQPDSKQADTRKAHAFNDSPDRKITAKRYLTYLAGLMAVTWVIGGPISNYEDVTANNIERMLRISEVYGFPVERRAERWLKIREAKEEKFGSSAKIKELRSRLEKLKERDRERGLSDLGAESRDDRL